MKRICKNCGYIDANDIASCPICTKNEWEKYEVYQIKQISTDEQFISAMIKLYEEDPIEYQLKLQQLKNAKEQEKQIERTKQQEISEPKLTCPKCGSSNITDGTKGFSLTTGFIGSGNFRYVCKSCGNKWKPGSMLEILQRANNRN